MMRRLPHVIAIVACLVVAWLLVMVLPQMPEQMASKFGLDGAPVQFISRSTFGWIMTIVTLLMAIIFALVALIGRVPDRMINMPAKDYWLAPERRERSMADVVLAVRSLLAAAMAVVAGATWLSLEANHSNPPHLPSSFLWMMAVYAAVFVIVIVKLFRRFRRP